MKTVAMCPRVHAVNHERPFDQASSGITFGDAYGSREPTGRRAWVNEPVLVNLKWSPCLASTT